jgi:hypothetical protein
MSLIVKVCGCRPHEGGAAGTGAGVRKPPMEETAGGGARWRVRRCGDLAAVSASTTFAIWHKLCEWVKTPFAAPVQKGRILQLLRYVPDGSLCTASVEQIFPRDSVQRNCFELALYIMTASPIASVRVFETVRDAGVVALRSVRSQRCR